MDSISMLDAVQCTTSPAILLPLLRLKSSIDIMIWRDQHKAHAGGSPVLQNSIGNIFGTPLIRVFVLQRAGRGTYLQPPKRNLTKIDSTRRSASLAHSLHSQDKVKVDG